MSTRIAVPSGGMLKSFALALSMVLACGTARAAVIEKVIVSSEVETFIPETLVLANMHSAPGTEFRPRVLSEDIKRLYQTGHFEDIQSSVAEAPGNKVVITISVTPKRVVRSIEIEGNKSLRTRGLRSLIKHELAVPLDETQVAADVNALRKRYTDKGYSRADVSVAFQAIPNTHEVNLVFRIEEEERYKLKRLRLVGNTVFSDRQLLKEVRMKRAWWRYIFRWGNHFDDEKLRMDLDAIRQKYTSKGYLDFKVTRTEKQFNQKRTWVTVTLHVLEGSPYTVSSVDITGNQRFSTEELSKLVNLEPAMIYDSDIEDADIKAISSKYEELGYLDYRCFPVRRTDSGSFEVAIEYRMYEGVPSRIRDIYIQGNEVTKDHVIRRELAIHPGDLGNAAMVRSSKSRLESLNYFEEVNISHRSTEKEAEKDLTIKVIEKRTGQLMLGAGFSSEDAVLGFFEVSQANFDWKNWPTFRGGGQRLRLRAQLGTERTDFMVSFTEPWWLHRRLSLNLEAYGHTRAEREYDQETLGVGASVTKPWLTFWRQSAGLHVRRITLSGFDSTASPQLLSEKGTYNASSIVLSLARDTRDRYINPTRGSRLMLSTDIHTELIGSYSNVVSAQLSGTQYFPLPRRAVLKLDGTIAGVDRITGDRVAIFDRLFAGGAYSIRGFKRRYVSPVDVNEHALGGKSMLLGSVEYIYPLFERVRVCVFSDSGNVWTDLDDIDPTELNISVGVGLQIDLPIGPIRLDYGHPVVTQQDHLKNASGRLHFNLGYQF